MAAKYSLSLSTARRRVVAGNAKVATDGDNFRYWFSTTREARDYVRDTGLYVDPGIWAIVRMPLTRLKHGAFDIGGRMKNPKPKRGTMASTLSPSQLKRYRGSRQAKAEAEAHGMSLEQWYRVAPDLKAFRGHAPTRKKREGETNEQYKARIDDGGEVAFAVYIARDSDVAASAPSKREAASAASKRRWQTRKKRDAEALARHERLSLERISLEGPDLSILSDAFGDLEYISDEIDDDLF